MEGDEKSAGRKWGPNQSRENEDWGPDYKRVDHKDPSKPEKYKKRKDRGSQPEAGENGSSQRKRYNQWYQKEFIGDKKASVVVLNTVVRKVAGGVSGPVGRILANAVRGIEDDLRREAERAGDSEALRLIDAGRWDAVSDIFPEAARAEALRQYLRGTGASVDLSGNVRIRATGEDYTPTTDRIDEFLACNASGRPLMTETVTLDDEITPTGDKEDLVAYAKKVEVLASGKTFVLAVTATVDRTRHTVKECIVWDPIVILTLDRGRGPHDLAQHLRGLHARISRRAYEMY